MGLAFHGSTKISSAHVNSIQGENSVNAEKRKRENKNNESNQPMLNSK